MAKTTSMKYQPKPHQGKGRKEELLAILSSKVAKANAFVFVNYQGLTHHQLEALKKLQKNGCRFCRSQKHAYDPSAQ